MIVLEDDNTASTSSKGKKGKKSQKDRFDSSVDHVSTSSKGKKGKKSKTKDGRLNSSEDYVLVFCHLEILRHSLSSELHLTQVSILGCETQFHCKTSFKVGGHNSFKWEIFKHQNLSSCDTTWWERTLTCTIYMTS